ncbi:MAG: hypothetical protein IJ512_01770 [Ruminococcus sp.]|nr:hypothetical protein [Ruminococcus sp.]
MKKIIRTFAAASVCAVISAMPFTAQAAEAGSYIHSIQLERYAVTAEEAASGEAVIHAATYLKGKTGSGIAVNAASAQVLADESGQIYFSDIYDPTSTYTENTYEYLGGSFTTSYRPFCFGNVTNGKYSTKSFNAQIRDVCTDPVAGNPIYYNGLDENGDHTITFKLHGRYYVNEQGQVAQDSVTHDMVCPLTIYENGSATYSFQFADIYYELVNNEPVYYANVATKTGTIPYFLPDLLEKGDTICAENDILSWVGDVTSPSAFLGNSDDFPFMETNVRFKKGTPCGIYNVTLNQNYGSVTVDSGGTSSKITQSYEDAAIAVGVDTASGISVETPEYACYLAENNKMITANSMGATYICDVAFTDGTAKTQDATNAVNGGTSPNALWMRSAQNYFIGEVEMLVGDTPIAASYTDSTPLTQTVLIGKKGDVNLDGAVSIDDASAVLRYYAANAAGLEAALTDDPASAEETLAFFLGDIDTQSQTKAEGGSLEIGDASDILSYYASTAAGILVSWDTFLS